jgi:peptide/nickel transport system permease protein/oligopeptide transport system permease protein
MNERAIRTPNQKAWMRFKHHRLAAISLCFLALVLVLLCVWPFVSPYTPDALSDAQFQPPSSQHWCGTDVHGRDLLARIVAGARISLLVGAVGAGVSLVIGVAWGALAGYIGGRTDELMMRMVDVLYCLPNIVFVIVLITTLEDRLNNLLPGFLGGSGRLLLLFIGLGAISWLTMARIVRGQVLSLRTRSFVEASRTMGASNLRILWKHILPNVYGLIIVYLTLTVPGVMLYESFLSYLGLGIQPPMASWGSLLSEGASQLNPVRIYWWLIVFPGAALVTALLALNFLGDGLRDALDPQGLSS